jgi:hypothetical protein
LNHLTRTRQDFFSQVGEAALPLIFWENYTEYNVFEIGEENKLI